MVVVERSAGVTPKLYLKKQIQYTPLPALGLKRNGLIGDVVGLMPPDGILIIARHSKKLRDQFSEICPAVSYTQMC